MFTRSSLLPRLNSCGLLRSNIFIASLHRTMSTTPEDSPPLNATRTYDHIVQPSDLASSIASNAKTDPFPDVLATSRLIAFMEIASARLLQPCLKPNQLSVGTRVDITHSAPTFLGVNVTTEAKFIGKKNKIFLFEISASDKAGEVGRGIHERAIVEAERLENGAKKRAGMGESSIS